MASKALLACLLVLAFVAASESRRGDASSSDVVHRAGPKGFPLPQPSRGKRAAGCWYKLNRRFRYELVCHTTRAPPTSTTTTTTPPPTEHHAAEPEAAPADHAAAESGAAPAEPAAVPAETTE